MSAGAQAAPPRIPLSGDITGRLLDLDLRVGIRELPFLRVSVGLVDLSVQVLSVRDDPLAASLSRIGGQGGDIGFNFPDHEGPLVRPGLDQAQGGEQLDRVSYGVS